MAEQSIDKLTLEVEVTAKNTSAAFKELESQLSSLQKALTSLDTSKLKAINGAFRASKVKIDTSGVSKAEKDISSGIDKIKSALAGLEAYANKSATGDKSAFSAYERQALSLQSEIDKMWEKFRQQGNVSVPTKAFDDVQDQIKITAGEVEALEAKWQRAMDSGGASEGYMKDLTMQIVEAKANLEDLYAKQDKLLNEGKAFADPFEKYRDSVDEVQGKLDQFSTIVNQAMAEIDANKAAAALDPLSEKLLKDLPAGIEHVKEAFAGLGSYANAAMNGDASALTSFERRVTSIQSEIGVLSEKLRQLSTDANIPPESITAFDTAIREVSKSVSDLSGYVKNTVAESQKGISPKTDSSGIRNLTKDIKEANRELFKMDDASKRFAGKIGSLFKGLGKSITGIGKGLSDASDKGFMKFLKYGLGIRSVYVLFRRLRKAVVESFGDLQTSGAFFETTRANIEALKNSLATLKFQFGAAFEPIFNAVAPALQAFINYLITAANVISAFMAKLTGKSTYSKVQSVTLAAKNNLGGAAKNAKELNKQLQKFDELNNLTTNNGGGGGGGGGGADSDSARYTEEAVDNVLGDFGQRLAEQIRAGDWEGVGRTISDKLSEAMESIPWDDVYAKARGFGKGLADFLNGLINPRLFGNVGKTLANSLNTAFEFLNTFGNEFSWTNFGNSLGEGISEFFRNADFALWGDTVHTWIAGILDAGIALVENTDWAEIGNKLGEFLENLDIPDLVGKLAKFAGKLALGIGEALLNLATHGQIGAITAGLIAVLGTAVFTGKLSSVASKIANALGSELTGTKLTISKVLLAITEFELVGSFTASQLGVSADELGFKELAEEYKNFSEHPITYTIEGLADIVSFINEDGFGKFAEALASIFDPSGEFVKTLKHLFGMDEDESFFTGPADVVMDYVKEHVDGWSSGSHSFELTKPGAGADSDASFNGMETDYFDKQKNKLNSTDGGTSILNGWNMFYDKYFGNGNKSSGFFKGIGKSLDSINKKFQQTNKSQNTFLTTTEKGSKTSGKALKDNYDTGAIKPIGEAFSSVYDAINRLWSKTGEDSKQYSKDFYTGFDDMPDETASRFGQGYTQSTKKWSDFGSWVKEMAATINRGFDGTPTETSTKFGEAYSQSTNKWANIGSWIKEKANIVNTGFNNFPSSTATKFGEAYTQGTSKFNNTGTWIQGVKNTISNKIAEVPGEFNTKFKQAADNATTQTKVFTNWFSGLNLKATATMTTSLPSTQPVKDKWNEIAGIWKDRSMKLTFETGSNFNVGSIKASINSLIDTLNKNMQAAVNSWKNAGMKIKSYTKVPFLASGGVLDMATPIVAGEAGAEAIVPLENNTRWLGKMANMMVGEMVKPQHLSIATSIASPYSSGGDASSVAEQNALLREEVQLLRQIAAKDFSIGSRDVYDAVRKENDDYINRMGYSPLFS